MKKKSIRSVIASLLAAVFALSLLLCLLPTSAGAVTQEDIDALEKLREELLEQREQSQVKIDTLRGQQASVLEQKAALDERNELAKKQLKLVGEQVVLYASLVKEEELKVEEARAAEAVQLERYRSRVRSLEENGSVNLLAVLLHARSLRELLTAVDDIAEILRRDREIADDYLAARKETERVMALYEKTKAEMEQKQAELRKESEELEALIAEAVELIEELEGDIDKALREYEIAEAARRAAEQEILDLIAELNKPKPTPTPAPTEPPAPTPTPGGGETPDPTPRPGGDDPAPTPTPGGDDPAPTPTPAPTPEPTPAPNVGDGSLLWPVPCSHRVTSRFGWRIHPITGEERYHNGMDIDGYNHDGEAIVSCDAGTVVVSTWSDSYGNYVIVDHGNGMQTLYAHMSGRAVSVGDSVTKGQTLGYLGATGWATGTHCHLEIFVDGGRVDPENYFSGIEFYDC